MGVLESHDDRGVRARPSIADVAYLTRSAHRVTILEALSEHPLRRYELLELTGVSRSTVGRTLREFEERRWVRRDGPRYETTQTGAFVATAMTELIERLEAERQLRDVWQYLPFESTELRLEMVTDAVVTVAEADDPYAPVNRFVSLLDGTDRLRFIGSELALFEPCRDAFRRQVVDGMRAEIIDPPDVSRHIRAVYPDHCAETIASGNLTVRLHDELPAYAIGLFDDRVAICGRDPTSGTVRVLVDTDSTAVRRWAASVYDAYRRESRPLELESALE